MVKTPEQKLETNRRWNDRHRDAKREADRRYREAHREQHRETDRRYRAAHAEEINSQISEKRKSGEYKPSPSGSKPEYTRNYRARIRHQIIEALGAKCLRCGFDDWRALQVDHVNGGGAKHRRTVISLSRYYKDILASVQAHDGTYQLLCANCNQIKRYEDGEQYIPVL